jgi:hypothetical protein
MSAKSTETTADNTPKQKFPCLPLHFELGVEFLLRRRKPLFG